jgi:hypothetical protein
MIVPICNTPDCNRRSIRNKRFCRSHRNYGMVSVNRNDNRWCRAITTRLYICKRRRLPNQEACRSHQHFPFNVSNAVREMYNIELEEVEYRMIFEQTFRNELGEEDAVAETLTFPDGETIYRALPPPRQRQEPLPPPNNYLSIRLAALNGQLLPPPPPPSSMERESFTELVNSIEREVRNARRSNNRVGLFNGLKGLCGNVWGKIKSIFARHPRPIPPLFDDDCAICLSNMFEMYNKNPKTIVHLKNCDHIYCKECYDKLIRFTGYNEAKCPQCRTNVAYKLKFKKKHSL